MSDNAASGDDVDAFFNQLERASKIDADNNYRVMDNHLMHTDRVIANVATLKSLSGDEMAILKALAENPT